MDAIVLFHQGAALFQKSQGVQDEGIGQGSLNIPVDRLERQVIKKTLEYRDLFSTVVEKGNVFGRAAAFEMFAPQLIAAGPVAKTDDGMPFAVQGKIHLWQDRAAISGGMLLLRRY